jgi:peptidoglycan hydrolase-like protein with peptidoglycan-binding domain
MTGAEPALAFGDAGDPVLQLQKRLQALGLFDGSLDGAFGDDTKAAVMRMQHEHGVPANGDVGDETWTALARAEHEAGPDPSATPVGTLSEDQQWRWDGDRWQSNEDRADGADPRHDQHATGHVSADGQWLWDGNQWQPVKQ